MNTIQTTDGYTKIRNHDFDKVNADLAALREENAKLREALKLGLFMLSIPAIRQCEERQIADEQKSPITDFEKRARALLGGEA